MSLRRSASPSRLSPLSGGGTTPSSSPLSPKGAGAEAQNVALISNHHHTDMSSSESPYVNAATFEPTTEQVQDLKQSQQRWNCIVFTTGLTTFFVALMCLATIESTSFATACFIWPLLLGPYIIHQRRYLNRYPTLRRLINRIRFHVNRLQVQNNKFAAENARLEQQVGALQQTEFQLHQLCQAQGSNVAELQALIQENGVIQKEMKKLQDAAELHDILRAILMSDSNMDAMLSDEEMHRLTLRLKCFSIVDEERLKQALRMTMLSSTASSSPTAMSYYDVHPHEEDVEIVARGALSGVDGWMV